MQSTTQSNAKAEAHNRTAKLVARNARGFANPRNQARRVRMATTRAARAGGRAAEPGDAAVLAAVSMCFALGAATTEQFKHLTAAEAGPLAGLGTLPGLRTLRPRLSAYRVTCRCAYDVTRCRVSGRNSSFWP